MRTILYMVAALSVLLLSGCVMYSDKDEIEEPRLDVSDLLYAGYVEPMFRAVELADFFDRYQDIREDREQAVALGTSYFGESFDAGALFYENFSAYPDWGDISRGEADGEYLCSAPYSKGLLTGITLEYRVKDLGDRCYAVSCDAGDASGGLMKTVEALAEFRIGEDGTVRAEHLQIDYSEDSDVDKVVAVVSGDGAVAFHLCSGGQISFYPFAGALHFDISGTVTDSFDMVCSESGVEIYDCGGSAVSGE